MWCDNQREGEQLLSSLSLGLLSSPRGLQGKPKGHQSRRGLSTCGLRSRCGKNVLKAFALLSCASLLASVIIGSGSRRSGSTTTSGDRVRAGCGGEGFFQGWWSPSRFLHVATRACGAGAARGSTVNLFGVPPGTNVIVQGLSKFPALNGKAGVILRQLEGPDEAYEIKLLETGESKKLRRANLALEGQAGNAFSAPQAPFAAQAGQAANSAFSSFSSQASQPTNAFSSFSTQQAPFASQGSQASSSAFSSFSPQSSPFPSSGQATSAFSSFSPQPTPFANQAGQASNTFSSISGQQAPLTSQAGQGLSGAFSSFSSQLGANQGGPAAPANPFGFPSQQGGSAAPSQAPGQASIGTGNTFGFPSAPAQGAPSFASQAAQAPSSNAFGFPTPVAGQAGQTPTSGGGILAAGARVVVQGLQKSPELNGRVGLVVRHLQQTPDEAYEIKLTDTGESKNMRRVNLDVLAESAGAGVFPGQAGQASSAFGLPSLQQTPQQTSQAGASAGSGFGFGSQGASPFASQAGLGGQAVASSAFGFSSTQAPLLTVPAAGQAVGSAFAFSSTQAPIGAQAGQASSAFAFASTPAPIGAKAGQASSAFAFASTPAPIGGQAGQVSSAFGFPNSQGQAPLSGQASQASQASNTFGFPSTQAPMASPGGLASTISFSSTQAPLGAGQAGQAFNALGFSSTQAPVVGQSGQSGNAFGFLSSQASPPGQASQAGQAGGASSAFGQSNTAAPFAGQAGQPGSRLFGLITSTQAPAAGKAGGEAGSLFFNREAPQTPGQLGKTSTGFGQAFSQPAQGGASSAKQPGLAASGAFGISKPQSEEASPLSGFGFPSTKAPPAEQTSGFPSGWQSPSEEKPGQEADIFSFPGLQVGKSSTPSPWTTSQAGETTGGLFGIPNTKAPFSSQTSSPASALSGGQTSSPEGKAWQPGTGIGFSNLPPFPFPDKLGQTSAFSSQQPLSAGQAGQTNKSTSLGFSSEQSSANNQGGAHTPPAFTNVAGQSTAAEDVYLQAGTRVVLRGLSNFPALNAKIAVVVKRLEIADEAYEVKLVDTGDTKKLRRANLVKESQVPDGLLSIGDAGLGTKASEKGQPASTSSDRAYLPTFLEPWSTPQATVPSPAVQWSTPQATVPSPAVHRANAVSTRFAPSASQLGQLALNPKEDGITPQYNVEADVAHLEEAIAAFNLGLKGLDGGGDVDGQVCSEKECYEKALSLHPKTAFAWFMLGYRGGGKVSGRRFSEKDCYEKAASLDPRDGNAWFNLGVENGGQVNGKSYSRKECYERALSINEKDGLAWLHLGVEGGGEVYGHAYSKKECYEKSLSVDSEDAVAWYNLGIAGGGAVAGRKYSKIECYQKTLCIDEDHAAAWSNMGVEGGGTGPDGQRYSAKDCYERALSLDLKMPSAWYNLALEGGGRIQKKSYSEKECFEQALSWDSHDAQAWQSLGNLEGGKVKGRSYTKAECYEQAARFR